MKYPDHPLIKAVEAKDLDKVCSILLDFKELSEISDNVLLEAFNRAVIYDDHPLSSRISVEIGEVRRRREWNEEKSSPA